ncbi:AGAP008363-PA-like protein [Anopheles sinensis]|uniref:AGAP008363-PA-like protein n=1 Tax=Anopheles sinensis TaxID=74873 RepID=A0A084W5W5_ANOSI|nr:AGAP008363-PA-like protein [Anopheles sinensis]
MSTVDAQLHSPIEGNQAATILQLAMTALRLSKAPAADGNNNVGHQQRVRKQITLNEVSYHDSYDDCWIVLYDRVYDITSFLKMHPGGHDVLVENAGRDATIAFLNAGHSAMALKSLKLYEIGELPINECIYRCSGKLTMAHLPD